jgi:eukaryotic-like serine/threonine-protein kinase
VSHPSGARDERFEPVPGAVVAGKYRVERVLGEGGMGVVVAATHLGLDQRVAIKFLLPAAMRHKEAVERFQREARVAAKVTSEHVARVQDVGVLDGGEPFIVMEHLEGSDLRELIKGGPLPVADACEIALQACEALALVHAAGIVHRDLKPSNLFVTRRSDGSPCVKLLDFGISKFSFHDRSETDQALTATAAIMGSPSYMSPEQLKSSKEVDGRTDVWSLGAVLYEAVTGRPAFRGETVPQVCAMIASDDPPPPSSVRPEIPLLLDQIILDCLVKKPEQRARLVELARGLIALAPDRARVSLERMEAVLGEAPLEERRHQELPVLPLATSARGRTLSSSAWGNEGRRRRSGGALALLVLLALGASVAWLRPGEIDVRSLRGRIVGATSAVASAVATALPSAAPLPTTPEPPTVPRPAIPAPSVVEAPSGTVAAAAPSAAPVPSGAPVPSAAPGASEGSEEPAAPESEPAPTASEPAAKIAAAEPRMVSAPAHAAVIPARSVQTAPKRHPSKLKHGASKLTRKHH